jgi:hypothetical protein
MATTRSTSSPRSALATFAFFVAILALSNAFDAASSSSSSSSSSTVPAAAASVASDDDPATRLVELTPRNFARVVDGRRVVVCAFVNPVLPRSVALHAVLHDLRVHFAALPPAESAVVAFADVGTHRSFAKQYALKRLPTLLAFPRGPNLAHAPIAIGFEDNKTAAHYRRDIEAIVAHCGGLAGAPAPLRERTSELMQGVLRREAAFERQERGRDAAFEAAREKAAAAEAAAAEAAAAEAAAVAPDGDAAAAAAATFATLGPAAPSAAATPKALRKRARSARVFNASEPDGEELAGLRNESAALLRELDDELAAQIALVDARRSSLVALRALAAGIEANGTAALARLMNLERAEALRLASIVPLDLEMVGATAQRRLDDFARLSLIVDLFESLAPAAA